MFHCFSRTEHKPIQPENSSAANQSEGGHLVEESTSSPGLPSRRKFLSSLGIGLGVSAVAPHTLCLLVGGGAGASGLYYWCSHGEPTLTEKIPLERLTTVPEKFKTFPEEQQKAAAFELLKSQPVFNQVIAFKESESPGEEIKVVFALDQESKKIVVGFCKNGMTCPCSKPQFYVVGEASQTREQWSGQVAVLLALQGDK